MVRKNRLAARISIDKLSLILIECTVDLITGNKILTKLTDAVKT